MAIRDLQYVAYENYRLVGYYILQFGATSLEVVIFCVFVSVHHKLIYIKNQRDANWQYVY